MSEPAIAPAGAALSLAALPRPARGFRPGAPRRAAASPAPAAPERPDAPVEPTADAAESTAEAHARGLREGEERAARRHADERQALLALLANAEAFRHDSCDDLAALLGEAVERLVATIVGAAPVDPAWLHARVAAAAAVIAEADRDRRLRLNPLDAALLEDGPPGLPVVTDPALPRGAVRIETGSGWVEDGRPVYLDALRAALAAGGPAA